MASRRILIINNRVPYPLNDGGNIAVNAMIQGYHNAGWQVYLLAMNTSRHYIDTAKLEGIHKDLYAFDTVDIDNSIKLLPLLRNLLFSAKPNHAERFLHYPFAEKLQQAIASFNPDIIQVENIYLTEYLPLIRECTRAFTILRLHNVEYQVWARLALTKSNPLKAAYLKNLAGRLREYEHASWKAYDMLLPITDADKQVVSETNPGKPILTVPFGIDFSKVKMPAEKEQWVGYHIGAMDWQANADSMWWFLQKVWPDIYAAFPDFKFYFAGRRMPGAFKALHLPNVYCEGEVPDADSFIAGKKILFVPIHSGGGIRVKILEAMAIGKLVISTDIGMQGIDAVSGKHYLAANDAADFTAALQWIFSNKDKATEIAENAASFVRTNYDGETISHTLIKKIDNALEGNLPTTG